MMFRRVRLHRSIGTSRIQAICLSSALVVAGLGFSPSSGAGGASRALGNVVSVGRTLRSPGTTIAPDLAWRWENPLPNGNSLFSVACSGAICDAVGASGEVAVTHDHGDSWSYRRVAPAQWLESVSCPTSQTCVAVGDQGTIRTTQNDWRTWSGHNLSINDSLSHVSCLAVKLCYALGTDLTRECLYPPQPCEASGQNLLVKSEDGGRSWSPLKMGGSAILYGLSCVSTVKCMSVGDSGSVRDTGNGGATWWTPGTPVADVSLKAVDCVTQANCMAIGLRGIYTTHDFGRRWEKSTPLGFAVTNPAVLECFGGLRCVALGVSGFYKTTNFGRSWVESHPHNFLATNAFSCSANFDCIAVGDWGQILSSSRPPKWDNHTTGPRNDAFGISCPSPDYCHEVTLQGLTNFRTTSRVWTTEPFPIANPLLPPFTLSCPSPQTCFVSGQHSGSILATSDSGVHWKLESTPAEHAKRDLGEVTCPTTQICFAAGTGCRPECSRNDASVVKTEDGGDKWVRVFDHLTNPGPNIATISCPTPLTCFIAGSAGTIFRTTDGGAHWIQLKTRLHNAQFNFLTCRSAKSCFAVAQECPGDKFACSPTALYSSIVVSMDGGLTWAAHKISVRVEISDPLECGGTCKNYTFVGPVSCVGSTCVAPTQGGPILHTTDDWRTWRIDSTPTAYAMSAVTCPSKGLCYAAGPGGILLQATLP